MKVLVLGGTGSIGLPLVDLLTTKSVELDVYVSSRSPRKSKDNLTYLQGDAKDPFFLDSVLEGNDWDVIVDFMNYSTSEFTLRYQELLKSTKHYVFISSARVYADSNGAITEDSPRLIDVSKDATYLSSDEYSLAKAKQENLLFESCTKNWTIIRPYITYNDQRLQLGVLEKEDWLSRAMLGKPICISKDINEKLTTMTSGYDVARAITSLIGNKQSFGEAYHITSNKSVRWEEVAKLYASEFELITGKKITYILQSLDDVMKWHNGRYQVEYDRVLNRVFDNGKISKFIDVDKFLPPEEGLKGCLKRCMKNPQLGMVSYRKQAIWDRQTKMMPSFLSSASTKERLSYFYHRYLKNS